MEETAVGAACAILVALAVLPLRTAHAAELALAGYLRALAQLLDGLTAPGTPATGHGARTGTRILDASFHAATATLRPLTRTLLGTVNRRCTRVLRLVDLSHELGRTVAHDSAAVARAGSDLTQLAGTASRAASVALAEQTTWTGLPSAVPAVPPQPGRNRRAATRGRGRR